MKHLLSLAIAALIGSNLLGQNIVSTDSLVMVLCDDGSIYSAGMDRQVRSISQYPGSTSFTKSNTINNVLAITTTRTATLFLKNNGTVVGSGFDYSGATGSGSSLIYNSTFVPTLNLTNIIAISGGYNHALFLKNDGTVWASGYNKQGQLGIGTNTDIKTPLQVLGLTNIKAIAAGSDASYFLKDDGNVYSVGGNSNGQLGLGNTTNNSTPQLVTSLSNVKKIIAGYNSVFFIKNDGTVYTTGYNNDGQLGIGSNTSVLVPTKINGLSNVKNVATSNYSYNNHTLFLLENGQVAASGNNAYRQLGDGTTTARNTPVLIANLSDATSVLAGANFTIISKSNSTFNVVGANWDGYLGTGNYDVVKNFLNYSAPCNLLITSSDELSAANELTLYPNPSTGLVNIDGKIGTAINPIQVKVYNLSSALVYTETLNPSANSIDLSHLPSGMYFVQLINNDKIIASEKVVLD